MTHTKKSIMIGVVVAAILLTEILMMLQVEKASGSVITGQAYNSTTTISTSAGTHYQARSTSNVGGCELGTVTVASSSSSRLQLWNATSTTDSASTTIANFDESIAVGTYIFDLQCDRELIIAT